jgi:hypothetical protein
MNRLILLPAAALFLNIGTAKAQLVINDQLTAEQLVHDIFQGVGVTISNITINDQPGSTIMPSLGAFTYAGDPIVPDGGILMTNGHLLNVAGPATQFLSFQLGIGSDPDLMVLSGGNIFDRMVLEFDFVPDEDLLLFDYVMASEEYPSYTCSAYNDAFGFFLSGPGISGGFSNNAINLAFIPGTDQPVTINNVHPDHGYAPQPCPAVNEEYYHDNSGGQFIAYNGMTVILHAEAAVVPGTSYHMKLAIGDAGDSSYDTGLFFKVASFRSVPSSIITSVAAESGTGIKVWRNAQQQLALHSDQVLDEVRILDLQGRLLHTSTPRTSGMITIPMDVPGIVIVEATSGQRIFRQKVAGL